MTVYIQSLPDDHNLSRRDVVTAETLLELISRLADGDWAAVNMVVAVKPVLTNNKTCVLGYRLVVATQDRAHVVDMTMASLALEDAVNPGDIVRHCASYLIRQLAEAAVFKGA